jgi:dihydroorotate dehydrogenase
MLLVGATAVGIGSAVNYHGTAVFGHALEELAQYMRRHGYRSLSDFRGKALPNGGNGLLSPVPPVQMRSYASANG